MGKPHHLLFADGVHVYLDPGNAVYKKVLDAAWPKGEEVLSISDGLTVGDLVEAFFGYHWRTAIMGTKTMSGIPARFVVELERAFSGIISALGGKPKWF